MGAGCSGFEARAYRARIWARVSTLTARTGQATLNPNLNHDDGNKSEQLDMKTRTSQGFRV